MGSLGRLPRTEQEMTEMANQADALWVLVAAAMVFLMQAGFLSFEVGSVAMR